MKISPLNLEGAFVIEIEPRVDERGFFARTFCEQEFAEAGLSATSFVQCNVSRNRHRGILRGLHFQAAPAEEAKLVRCTAGAIYDVLLDLRRSSSTFLRWTGLELTEANHLSVFAPTGIAHGFLTLTTESEVFYQMSSVYSHSLARGVRWNDPAFGIRWPLEQADVVAPLLSSRDASFGDFNEEEMSG